MGYAAEVWSEFFLAAAGAAAALCGLIFVGLSINIATVLSLDKAQGHNFLIGRAREALAALLVVLAVSLLGLVPGIPSWTFGLLVVLTALGSATSPVLAVWASRHPRSHPPGMRTRLTTAVGFTLCLAAAGATLLAGVGGGLYWLPAAFLLAVLVAAVNSWVLLVEVLR